ncbi:MAG: DNA topoisomerase 4 subunit A [Clostridiales bacterium]|jgi:DNA gyrase subunit A|nr:DNA topoisomerase 4 subunit A [Clostridiales bacterium]
MKKENAAANFLPDIREVSLEEVMHGSMIPYAEFVIMDRALPRVEDGLKPVQRRILYTMYELGLTPDKPYKKSARIVGDCLGKYHPHGDKSVYDAMVRMAQPFNMRMPLIDGHGNYGSMDGDGAAAMRYTEARLAPLALELLKDIEKDTVRFSLNFDDSLKEPDMLPGRFPNLLVNGASGIAVGLATNIPPHNLGEAIDAAVAFIDNRRITLKEIMKIIKGPDFPTGGYIVAGSELEKAYATGKGRITLRARVCIENAEYDKKNIVITELPYQVNKSSLLQRVLELKEEKKELLSGIYDITDESDRSGMRAVIRLKKDCDPYEVLKILYKHTDLQVSYNINIVAIADGKPQQMGLLDIIHYYVDYQREVIIRRTRHEIREAKEREHILEGLVVAVRNIDEVVKIIKGSQSVSEAREKLRKRFSLTERQAQAILDMRLARLTSLEIYKLEQELKKVKQLIARLKKILDEPKEQMELLKKELLEIKRQYKDPRRSEVFDNEDSIEVYDEEKAQSVIEDFAVAVSAEGRIKRVPAKNFSLSQKDLTEKSELSDVATLLVETQNNAELLLFTNLGNCYKLPCGDIPECKWRERGTPLYDLLKGMGDDEKAVMIYPYLGELPQGELLFFTRQGYVKKSPWSEYAVMRDCFQAIKLKEGDEVIAIESDASGTTMFFVTARGICLNADKADLPAQGRIAGGVHGINLSEGDWCVFAGQASAEGCVIAVSDRGFVKKARADSISVLGRYRKGVKLVDLGKDKGSRLISAFYEVFPQQIAIEGEGGELIHISSEKISAKDKVLKAPKQLPKGFKARSAHLHRTNGQFITVQSKQESQ